MHAHCIMIALGHAGLPSQSHCSLDIIIIIALMRISIVCIQTMTIRQVKSTLKTSTTFRRFGAVGSDVDQNNEFTLRRARLVLGWVTYRRSTPVVGNLSQSNQPPRSTQPGHPSVGKRNEYRPKDGDALQLGLKADMVLFAGNTV